MIPGYFRTFQGDLEVLRLVSQCCYGGCKGVPKRIKAFQEVSEGLLGTAEDLR